MELVKKVGNTIRVCVLINGTVLFGDQDQKDIKVLHFPRQAYVEGRSLKIAQLIGDPDFIVIKEENLSYFYDTDNKTCYDLYWKSREPVSNIILPKAPKIM